MDNSSEVQDKSRTARDSVVALHHQRRGSELDKPRSARHNLPMPRSVQVFPHSAIPDFGLYGESALPPWYEPFYLERIAVRSRLHDFKLHPHRHSALIQILYVEVGSGETTIEGARFTLTPGCVLLIPAQAVHSHRFDPDIDGTVVTAAQRPLESLATAARPNLVQYLREPTLVRIKGRSREPSAISLLFGLLEIESSNTSPDHLAASMSLLFSLVVQIARLGTAGSSGSPPSPDGKEVKIERFRRLVDKNLTTHRSVASYAKSLGVTASQLARLCHDVIGMSPLDFINSGIVKEAQRYLVYTSLTVKQVALELGFNDPAYFSRFFHKQTGLNPTEFREAASRALSAPT